MSETKPRNTDVQKLQRAIVDGLEDVKGQDIVVFDTEHLSPLFERVIIASGTSNRQTKALASSVTDAVREAGFPKPRIEGETNGEWIIVDCGAAVAHVMQPNIRQYYHLEEIWGGKSVRLKTDTGAVKAVVSAAPKAAKKAVAKPGATTDKPASKTASRTVAKAVTKRIAVAEPVSPVAKKAARKAPAKTATSSADAAATATPVKIKTLVVGKPSTKKAATRTPAAKGTGARKVAARKPSV